MSARNTASQERVSLSEKSIIKDIKRDLIKFVPPLARRARRNTAEFEASTKATVSCDYGKTFDHMNPTVSFSQKRQDGFYTSVCEEKLRVASSQSVDRKKRRRMLSQREVKSYNPKKLVYPSVRKLKKWMTNSEAKTQPKSKNLKKILFDHINKNMKHMNLKVSQEIDMPSVSKMNTQTFPMKLPEIQKLGGEFKRIQVIHKKTGIMRRNKLLLEHIMHERIRNKQIQISDLQGYKTNVSVNCAV